MAGSLPRRARAARFSAILGALLLVGGGCGGGGDNAPGPLPRGQRGAGSEAARKLGFPAFATKNTTRVGGQDAVADAAAVSLAVFPSLTRSQRPKTVIVADSRRWQAAIASTALVAPLRAPILLSSDSVPDATRQALDALRPTGSGRLGSSNAVFVGAGAITGLKGPRIAASSPSRAAAAIDRLLGHLRGHRSRAVIVVSSEAPEYAIPAVGWAAASGDPILFVGRNSVPPATRAALARHPRGTRVYLLARPQDVSSRVFRSLGRNPRVGGVHRITGADPVESAVVFARYDDGTFGWNLNDPGHGFTVVSAGRPLDAVAAAPLSAFGQHAAILVTDSATRLPVTLAGFLTDNQPGYRDDPTRASLNRAWVIGDESAISVREQAEIDARTELVRVALPRARTPGPARSRRSGGPSAATSARARSQGDRQAPKPGGNVPSDQQVQHTLEELLKESPDRGGDASR